MTIYLRRFDQLELLLGLSEAQLNDPPLWLIKSFLPDARENGTISLFEVADRAEAQVIAAAFGMLRPKLKDRVGFLSCDADLLQQTGLKIAPTPGDLHHEFADGRHRDLHLATAADARTVAVAFAQGDPIQVEGKIVEQAAHTSIRLNQFACVTLAGRPETAGRHLLGFVRENIAVLQGVPAM